jgi:hypothetical protein
MKIDQPFRRVARPPAFVAPVGRTSGPDRNNRHLGPDGLAKDQIRPRVVNCLAGPLASITVILALTALAVVRSAHVPRRASVIAVLGAAVYDYLFFTPPLYPSTTPICRT